jgi:hypothetical protein
MFTQHAPTAQLQTDSRLRRRRRPRLRCAECRDPITSGLHCRECARELRARLLGAEVHARVVFAIGSKFCRGRRA